MLSDPTETTVLPSKAKAKTSPSPAEPARAGEGGGVEHGQGPVGVRTRHQRRPSGLKPKAYASDPTGTVPRSVPVAASHTRTVPSQLLVAMRRPSGLNAAFEASSSWPVRVMTSAPVSVSQIGTVRLATDVEIPVPAAPASLSPSGL